MQTGKAEVASDSVGQTKITMKFITKITTTGTTTFPTTVVWATCSAIEFLPACCSVVSSVRVRKNFQIAIAIYLFLCCCRR